MITTTEHKPDFKCPKCGQGYEYEYQEYSPTSGSMNIECHECKHEFEVEYSAKIVFTVND